MMSERKTRILGKMLSRYIGKDVIIDGRLTKVSAHGDSVEITTFDDIKVNVTLPNPFDGNAEGILEIWGTVKSKGTVEASWYTHFDAEACTDFDEKAYNDLVVIQHATLDKKWQFGKKR